ncbi:7006_t:CDS:1, partial [Racocetra persica]
SDNHKNKTELDNINNDDYFKNNKYIDHFENNEYDHFENNYEFLNNSDSIIENNDIDNNYSEDEILISLDYSELYKEIEDLESIFVNPFHAPKVDFNKPIYIPKPNINLNDLL